MESVPDFSSIIHSPSFTFLVGPQHTKLTIQSGLAQHVSKPLHNLMNGPTRESKHRIAVLEEDDVETFVAFCEYAYTGDYNVPRPEPVQEGHRHGVVASSPSTTTWREHYRSGSIASTVPPPAPSPPPQYRHRGQEAYRQSAASPEPPMAQLVSEPAPAEAKEPVTPTNAPEPEVESAPVPEAPADAAEPKPETCHEVEVAPEPPAEHVPANEEWAGPTEEPLSWEPEEPKASKKKVKKGKKGKKQTELVEEELLTPAEPVSLTPPSTPPPEVSAEPLPEPEVELVEELASAEPKPKPEPEPEPEVEPTKYYEQPAEEPAPAEEQPAPIAEGSMESSWTQDRGSGTSMQTQRQRPMLDMSFAQHQVSSPCEPGLSLWDEFTSLQYNDEPSTSKPSPVEAPSTDLPYITFHAKVYVFATRYLIPALAQLCLRKLHRDLLILSSIDVETADPSDSQILDGLAAIKAQMVLELVHYAYTKTARLEPISPTSATQLRENELRRLVVHYAACNVKELARYHSGDDSVSATPALRPVDAKVERVENSTSPKSLRALLDLTTELASDLVYRMM
ncbi:uncharacterized protein N7479_001084 [Penicillium vulpinum]|uniref:BTB domain-containing protein n=1 Tax=Penicillium vulpinum TaxID=29845 RepID=A0A1V6RF29_9EURO|nr:uncharacterized protein N7479_001084 [Penicillium vulpinum]KAJ5971166.1 hypothetical protein N7479_001084 [Penicillium vulpinum]OQE00114.1 hypothetical protein PENVUL_c058G05869 [Penicillium vulpinum]